MKIKFGMIALMLLFAFTFQTTAFAEEPIGDTPIGEDSTTQADETVDTTQVEETPTEDENVEETQSEKVYTIYVHEQCPHCQDVEDFVAENGLEENVNYIQLYNQEENYDELIAIFEDNNIPESDQGWPFLIVSEDPFEYVVGGDPIIDFLTEEFDIVVEETKKEVSNGGKLLLGVGGIVLLGVLGYGLFSILGKEE